uniref:Protein kinase domain-containing protein n=1 Tax=Mola mola TaxID=94237 RepID=A0A3Q3XCE0_MOLML
RTRGEPHTGSGLQKKTTFDLPSDSSDVTLEDIERCYDIGRAVGDGNFAVVRECRRRDNVQTLAVKIVERSKLIGREHMMQNELSLLGSLCHPRIVRLFAHHHTHTHSYLVMELVGGGDLFDAISEKGRFSESEAGLMVSDVSEALNYIHCKSIVHRDVKPENLLVSDVLKLGDFGLAMVVTEPVFTICGTPTYVAPEILCETGYGVAVDVWALGVILYILLCGFPPFRSKERDQEELFQLIKQGHFHFLSPYWDPISEARGLVTALLQPDPTMRLTAEQTWLHPWVTAMASICRQRAVPEKMADKTLGHTNRQAESIQKELSTSSEATAGAQRPEFTPTGSPCSGSTQDPDYDPGSQLGDPSTQSDPPGQMKRQSQESQEQSPPYSPTSTNQHPSSNPAAAFHSASVYQVNVVSITNFPLKPSNNSKSARTQTRRSPCVPAAHPTINLLNMSDPSRYV